MMPQYTAKTGYYLSELRLNYLVVNDNCTGWAKKTGPFLKVYDSCI